jgi:F0F1-type ATP synthase assembly protein I
MDDRERQLWREALRATSLGWDLAVPIFGGVLFGYVLDRSLGTPYVFTLGLLLLGIGAGFYNVLRSIHRLDQGCRGPCAADEDRDEMNHGAASG